MTLKGVCDDSRCGNGKWEARADNDGVVMGRRKLHRGHNELRYWWWWFGRSREGDDRLPSSSIPRSSSPSTTTINLNPRGPQGLVTLYRPSKPSSMAYLLPALPPELFALILAFADRGTVAVASRVCYGFLKDSGPLLYRNIVIRRHDQLARLFYDRVGLVLVTVAYCEAS